MGGQRKNRKILGCPDFSFLDIAGLRNENIKRGAKL